MNRTKDIFFSYTKPNDELRQRQLDRILITLRQAYNHYSQQDIPENIFDILFNHTPAVAENTSWNDDYTKEAKNEVHRLLWEIIEVKSEKKASARRWIPGSVQYPALIVQLLRVRFPSSEPDMCMPDCTRCDMKDFIKYTSSSTYVISSNHTRSIPWIRVKMRSYQ